jgi:hypothetical protein
MLHEFNEIRQNQLSPEALVGSIAEGDVALKRAIEFD